jgi:steroid 5-alpha reductase family enzyme
MCWWGVFLAASPGLSVTSLLASLGSPVFVTYLLCRVSGIPLLERAADRKFAGQAAYEAYKSRTPLLVPFL